jgi:cobalt/nickel transport system permease protein
MHIPDGFLSTPVWVAMNVAAVPPVGLAVRKAQAAVEENRVPLLGVMGAFVFAAQMINFPVGVGTSGHLVGGALLAVILGPAAATVVMTAILAVQALIFQDGGLLAMGANVFNMAVAGVVAGYLPYQVWGATRVAVFLGGVLSVLAAAALTVGELLASGVPVPGAILGVSAGLFAISALIEGGITLVVFQAIQSMNPAWINAPGANNRRVMVALGTAAVVIAVAGVMLASSLPDGLESLAEQAGFAGQSHVLLETPLGGYEAQFLEGEWPRKAAAGIAGLALIFGVCLVAQRWFASRRSATP